MTAVLDFWLGKFGCASVFNDVLSTLWCVQECFSVCKGVLVTETRSPAFLRSRVPVPADQDLLGPKLTELPAPASHGMWTQLKAGETVCHAGEVPTVRKTV